LAQVWLEGQVGVSFWTRATCAPSSSPMADLEEVEVAVQDEEAAEEAPEALDTEQAVAEETAETQDPPGEEAEEAVPEAVEETVEPAEGDVQVETEAVEEAAEALDADQAVAAEEESAVQQDPPDEEVAAEEGEQEDGEERADLLQEESPIADLEEADKEDAAQDGEAEEPAEAPHLDAEAAAQEEEDDAEILDPEPAAEEGMLVRQDLQEEEPEEAELEDDEEKVDPMQELTEKYDQLQELHESAMRSNVTLQRRVIQRKMQDKQYDSSEKPAEGKVTEHKYQNVLYNVHSVRMKLRLQQVKAARMSEELKNQLEAKRQKAIECRDSFQEFKRQVARHAEYARTGKIIPEKIIQEVEEFELDKDAEVEEVRGSNISLKNRLAKLEQLLRKKDELAENLHVIDFEQLKIENQTLNEKIEERNEELHKLRKKTVVTVQIITHMREKVQFVQQEYQALKGELSKLDQDLAAQRDLVAKTKHERDEYRTDNGKLRQQTGIINSEHLTRDFEARAESSKQLKESIVALKERHTQMLQFLKKHGASL